MMPKINALIEEGQKILESSDFDSFEKWKRSVQFFVEKEGSPAMTKEIEKEVNRPPLWITSTGSPPEHLEEQFRSHKVGKIKTIISILEAIESQSHHQSGQLKRDDKRQFSQTVKNYVWDKQDGRCLRCKEQLKLSSTHFDHITAWEDGGKSDVSNCQALCANCHGVKTNDDRLEKQLS